MDVELKWYELTTTEDQLDPRWDKMSYYLVDPDGLVLASVVPCDIHPGLWSVRLYVPLGRWVGYTLTRQAGQRLAELARTDSHPLGRWGRDKMPIETGLLPPKPCVTCGKPAGERVKCFDCERVEVPVVDVTPDPNLRIRCTCSSKKKAVSGGSDGPVCPACGGRRVAEDA